MPKQPHDISFPLKLPRYKTLQLSFIFIRLISICIFREIQALRSFSDHYYESWGADVLETWDSRRDCTDNWSHLDLLKKFHFTLFAFYCCFCSVTSRHYSPDRYRFIETRISHLKCGKDKYRLGLVFYAAVLIHGVCHV